MSEQTEQRAASVEPLVETVLAAVDGPALVCDPTGRVRTWNAAMAARAAVLDDGSEVRLREVVAFEREGERDSEDGDRRDNTPFSRAVETGERTRGAGRVVDGPACTVTCRPVERGGGDVTAVVVTCEVSDSGDSSGDEDGHGGSDRNGVRHDSEQLATILDRLPVTTVLVDGDGRITNCSADALPALDVDLETFVGAPIDRFESVWPDLVAGCRRALEGEATRATASIGDRTVEAAFEPLGDGEETAALAVALDVTDRERRARELESAKRRLDMALEGTKAGVYEWVVGEDRVYWHETTSRLFGLDPEVTERDRAAFAERVHPEDRERVHDRVMTAVENDERLDVEYRIRRSDGETRWMVSEGEVHTVDGTDRLVGMVRDVTERKERERELERTNRRLDLALEHAEAGVYEWYVDEDRIRWHDSTVRLFDVDRDRHETVEEAARDLIHPDDRQRVLEAIGAAVADGVDLAVEFRTADGERWAAAEGTLVGGEDGEPERIVGTVRDVTERRERENELAEREQRLRAVIEGCADPIAMQDRDGRYRVVNEALLEWAGGDREDVIGTRPTDVFDEAVASGLEDHRRDVLDTERARVVEEQYPDGDDRERVHQITLAPYHGPDGEVRGTVTIARDITELERQRDELETLTEIQDLVQESVRALAAATTREEIKETVCDRLAESRFYEFAWIGERVPSEQLIAPTYAAGEGEDYLDDLTVRLDPSEHGRGPAGEAYRSGEVEVVHDIAEDPDFEPWREAALERGFRSAAAVPLTHGSTTHGILAVYADWPGAFSKRELVGFRTVGEVVGFALSAAQYRRLVEAETVLELEYEVRTDPFIAASTEHDCRFVLDHAAHTGQGRVVTYVTVEDADPDIVRDVTADLDNVESMRRLDGEAGPHFEVTFTESVFQYLADLGARGRRGVVEDGIGHLFVDAPGEVDVRQVTAAVERRFGDVEMVAKRERSRSETPWWHAHGDIDARLTDRQRAVLRAAYYSGYYEWPRETDAETLADSLDVASATALQHLRKGHRRILEAMFES